MKIIEINKTQYRNRLNKVIVGFIVTFALLSVLIGSGLIALFSDVASEISTLGSVGDEAPSNFKFNFLGVLLGLLACTVILHHIKNKPYFYEIYYVWQLKQIQNLIYRKLKKIKSAAFDQQNIDALIVLHYYYASLKQVYVLDDNTLTISNVNKEQQKLENFLTEHNLKVDTDQFDKSLIASI